ncbi:M12 family metallo-peptidase [Apibacter sp. HY039]|uniref:zinc-dependent metalloprotease family protein n=1 Tax=Apibacter sp. HY039 TaxID=2501476 RepID=UPI000FEBD097|nr:M12 family metallo-peptidase [Apibacter sp. HY039]
MKNLYLVFAVLFGLLLKGQQAITINSTDKNLKRLEVIPAAILKNDLLTGKDIRVRKLNYNTQLNKLKPENVGDTLLLNLFEDKKYKAVIDKISQDKNKEVKGITAKVLNSKYGYCFLSISLEGISFSVELPEADEQYLASTKHGQSYLFQYKMSEIKNLEIPCAGDIHIEKNDIDFNGDHSEQSTYYSGYNSSNAVASSCISPGIEEPVTINVMVVYTPAAQDWASEYWMVTDIDHLIDQAMLKSNLVMHNSQTGVTFNLVYKHLTNYIESDTSEDLSRIRINGDGYMDEVHELRKLYQADLVVFMPKVNFTGGLAGLLYTEAGDSQHCGFSLSRVQQSSWAYTMVHEIGHNMGCSHHSDQLSYPGPGIYKYSSGWRGVDFNGNKYSTVMTYENGRYFSDGNKHPNIPYFSSPDMIVNGVAIGDAQYANNVLTIKKNKYVTSMYSEEQLYFKMESYFKTYGNRDPYFYKYFVKRGSLLEEDEIIGVREPGENAGRYLITGKVYRGNREVSCEYYHYMDYGILTINKRNVRLRLNDKTVTYTGKHLQTDDAQVSNLANSDQLPVTYVYTKDNVSYPLALEAGNYTVIAYIAGNQNYHSVNSSSARFTVLKAQPVILLTEKKASYSGLAVSIDSPLVSGSDTVSDLPIKIEYEGIEGTEYPLSELPPINQGTYIVKASTPEDNNHFTATAETKLVIEKTLGINDPTEQKVLIQLSPNPVGQVLNILLATPLNYEEKIFIYDWAGALIKETVLLKGEEKKVIDFSHMNPGSYIIKFKNRSFKIVKK